MSSTKGLAKGGSAEDGVEESATSSRAIANHRENPDLLVCGIVYATNYNWGLPLWATLGSRVMLFPHFVGALAISSVHATVLT